MRFTRARIRDSEAPQGSRVLVDRIWPRGMKKENADVDLWAKDLTPSTDLRKWFHADPEGRHDEFAERFIHELDETDHQETLDRLADLPKNRAVVLLTDAKDIDRSHVPIIEEWLHEHVR